MNHKHEKCSHTHHTKTNIEQPYQVGLLESELANLALSDVNRPNIIFIAELLPNINAIQVSLCFLETTSQNFQDPPKIRINQNHIEFSFDNSSNPSPNNFKIHLEQLCAVKEDNPFASIRFTPNTSLDLKVSLQPNAGKPDYQSKKLLKPADLTHIFCKSCSNSLLTTDDTNTTITRVLSMPSPYWLELSDMWICGCCNHTFDQFPLSEITAVPSTCLVGDNYLLMHKQDLRLQQLQIPSDSEFVAVEEGTKFETKWIPIHCVECNNRIGIGQVADMTNNNTATVKLDDISSFRLFKHKISNVKDTLSSNNFFFANTLETIIAADIFAASQAHRAFRFFICDSTTNRIVLQVWLTNWDTWISSNGLSNSDHTNNDLAPVLKLMFKELTANDQESSNNIKTWQQTFAVEMLFYKHEECLELLNVLQSHNSLFPQNRRTFSGMKIAFLRRRLEEHF